MSGENWILFFLLLIKQSYHEVCNNEKISGLECACVATNMRNFQMGLGFYLRCISFNFSRRNEQFGRNKKLQRSFASQLKAKMCTRLAN